MFVVPERFSHLPSAVMTQSSSHLLCALSLEGEGRERRDSVIFTVVTSGLGPVAPSTCQALLGTKERYRQRARQLWSLLSRSVVSSTSETRKITPPGVSAMRKQTSVSDKTASLKSEI